VAITSGQDDEPEGIDTEASGYLVYELNEWSRESRQMLQQLLESADVPYVWESTNLVVPAPFESQVDEATSQVEATSKPPLDPDAEKLLYELAEWTDDEVAQLVDALAEADLAYDFDVDGNLVVLATDEAAVEELLDTIEFPDALDVDEPDEPDSSAPAANDVLSDLFVASDRLRHHARDHEGVLGMVETAAKVDQLDLPYGFEPKVWQEILERAKTLRAALEGDDVTDEDIETQADELRSLLREFV
jgi:hypothetical protein